MVALAIDGIDVCTIASHSLSRLGWRRVRTIMRKNHEENEECFPGERCEEEAMPQQPRENEDHETLRGGVIPRVNGSEQPAPLEGDDDRGLYGYLYHAIYRLDRRTHQMLWKYVFTDNGSAIKGEPALYANIACVVDGVVYMETTGRYLYALNATTGSLLWKQPSTKAFVNRLAVYTLAKSLSFEGYTLTARDRHTGQSLWQRDYPTSASESKTEQGRDATRFVLITVSDQILYAVATSYQDGQAIFTRYGLSPEDGTIFWQNGEVMVGRMQGVEAQSVHGIIYTIELSVKRVAAYEARTGKRLWQMPMREGEFCNGSFALNVSDDTLTYQTATRVDVSTRYDITTLYALNRSDGTRRWEHQIDNGYVPASVLIENSLYFQTFEGGKKSDTSLCIVALDAWTGALRWSTGVTLLDGTEKWPERGRDGIKWSGRNFPINMAPVASTDAVYYSTPGRRVYILRPSDGTILEQFWVDKTDQTMVSDRLELFLS